MSFEIINLSEARFECTFGRGCDGVCCRNGRPLIYPEEIERIDAAKDSVLPLMRTGARRVVESAGFLSGRRKRGQRVARVVDGSCVFFNNGCVLHRLGESEGDAFSYKPAVCAIFPLDRDYDDTWYVRQKGFRGEIWALDCLDPARTNTAAPESLRKEIALAEKFSC